MIRANGRDLTVIFSLKSFPRQPPTPYVYSLRRLVRGMGEVGVQKLCIGRVHHESRLIMKYLFWLKDEYKEKITTFIYSLLIHMALLGR